MKKMLSIALFAALFIGFSATDANAFFFRRNLTVINNNIVTPTVVASPAVALPAFSTQIINTGLGFQTLVASPTNAALVNPFVAVGGVNTVGVGAGFGFGPRVAVRAGGVRVRVGGVGFRRGFVGGFGGRVAFRRFR